LFDNKTFVNPDKSYYYTHFEVDTIDLLSALFYYPEEQQSLLNVYKLLTSKHVTNKVATNNVIGFISIKFL